MANPQKENGHVGIANEIIEALAAYRIPGVETQCLWVIIRKTYGWNKTEDAISLSQFVLMMGVKRPAVIRALYGLQRKNIIIKKDNGNISIYKFNKDFESWKPFTKKITTFIPQPGPPPKCIMCGFAEAVERHHIIPQSKGGSNKNDNIAILCPNCHTLVHSEKITVESLIIKKGTCIKDDNTFENACIQNDNAFEQKPKNALSKMIHTKDTSTKDTSTKDTPKTLPPKKQGGPSIRAGSKLPCQENTLGQPKYSEKFELFWMAYPTRDGMRGSKQEAWVEFSAFSEKIQGEIVVAARNYAATNPKFGVTDAVRFIIKGRGKKKIHPFVEYVESVKTKSSEDRVNEIRKLLERDK